MNVPMPPVPQKTGHAIYAVITLGAWFVLSPLLLFIGSQLPTEIGGLFFVLSFVVWVATPAVWVGRSIQVSAINKRNAAWYQQQVYQYNSQFYGQQTW